MDRMHEQALKHHGYFGFEALYPQLRHLERNYSVVLSVNSGYE
jgi:hypothetical protein